MRCHDSNKPFILDIEKGKVFLISQIYKKIKFEKDAECLDKKKVHNKNINRRHAFN